MGRLQQGYKKRYSWQVNPKLSRRQGAANRDPIWRIAFRNCEPDEQSV